MSRINYLLTVFDELKVDGMIITSYPNIFYFSKFTSEDCILYINRDKSYLITDSRYTLQAKREVKGFEIIIRNSSYISELKKIIKGNRILFEDAISFSMYKELKDQLNVELIDSNIDHLRNIKDKEEIRYITRACNIASECYYYILDFIKPGMKESTIANEMVRFMKEKGAISESFATIVASGTRGALPHGVASEKIVEEGDFITLDYGCMYKGYCSDITRSFMLGKGNDKLIEIYNVVKEAQKRAIKGVKAGVKASEIDKIARDYIISKGYGKYFIHSTGHGLGVVVHDPISISKSSDIILEENMVITIEPGIYIKGLGGIRIEDDVLVTQEGYKVLTKASKKLISI